MKKVLTYIVSLFLGLLIGVSSFSIINTYFPKKEKEKVDYITYLETIEYLNSIEVKYGTNIDENYKYEMFMNNAFKNLNLYEILNNDEQCSMANCINKINTFNLNTEDIKKEIKKIYGPDITYPLKDFNYNTGTEKGKCTYIKEEDVYSCTISYIEYEEQLELRYEFIKMEYTENGIEAISNIYYIEYGCGSTFNEVCLYKDPFKKELITKCRYNEISDYKKYFNIVNMSFTKSSNNKYYLTSLNW